jgi:cellulose synthase/poly-beta-1,6-N-acetylglucosamine synthase-like glycosyltransferase
MRSENKITIVLISHKSTNNVLKFVEGLSTKYHILVIDNSNDYFLKEKLINKINVKFHTSENRGYGAAINYANNLIKTDLFFVFNPDILNINDGFIDFFYYKIKYLENDFLCIGPRYVNVNAKSHKQSDIKIKIAKINAINGACMLINKKNFNLLNGFDENIFLFFEENDLCKRGLKKGLNIYQINEISVMHASGTSVEVSNEKEMKQLISLRNWHFIWSKFYFYRKHYGFFLTLIYFIPTLFRMLFRIFIYSITKNKEKKNKFIVRLDALLNAIKGLGSSMRM